MATKYQDPLEAQQGLNATFSPTTDAQRDAIDRAASLVPGQAPVPPAPPKRTIDPGVAAAEKYLTTFKQPESSAQIAERLRQSSSGLIDSINNVYNDEVGRAKKRGDERVAMDNAVSVLSGLTGSTEASRTRNTVNAANDEEVQAINKRRLMELSGVYTKISADAQKEAREQIGDATRTAEQILTRRKERQSSAIENLRLMASSGAVDYDSFKNSPQNADVFNYALDSVDGSEDALRGLFALNRPKETVLDKKWVGSKLYQVYQNPITGKTRSEVVDLGFEVPPNYTTEVDLGDRVMLLDPNNPDKKLVFSKGLSPKDRQDADAAAGDPQKAQATINLVKSALDSAKELAGASGRSGARRAAESWFVGSTDYTNLVAQTNTLKTNVLTLVGDPTIKKFFGPQMSNADVTLMTSAGTTLNPELQSPEKLKSELIRLEDLINRMDSAVPKGTSGAGSGGSIITAPDGTQIQLID